MENGAAGLRGPPVVPPVASDSKPKLRNASRRSLEAKIAPEIHQWKWGNATTPRTFVQVLI